MRKFNITGMRVHEYSEFEWADMTCKADWDADEYVAKGVEEAKARKLRYFSVLVKPADELLSDAKAENPHIIDTWRWDAKIKADGLVAEYGDNSALHQTALLALLAKYVNASIQEDKENGALKLFIQLPTTGRLHLRVPERMADLFKLPTEEKYHEPVFWDTAKLLEAVFLIDRKAQPNG